VLRNCRDVIDRQVTQLTRLVDDLLDVSRLTTGKIKLRKELLPCPTWWRAASRPCGRPSTSAGHRSTSTFRPATGAWTAMPPGWRRCCRTCC
jgi:hypothetical protein